MCRLSLRLDLNSSIRFTSITGILPSNTSYRRTSEGYYPNLTSWKIMPYIRDDRLSNRILIESSIIRLYLQNNFFICFYFILPNIHRKNEHPTQLENHITQTSHPMNRYIHTYVYTQQDKVKRSCRTCVDYY